MVGLGACSQRGLTRNEGPNLMWTVPSAQTWWREGRSHLSTSLQLSLLPDCRLHVTSCLVVLLPPREPLWLSSCHYHNELYPKPFSIQISVFCHCNEKSIKWGCRRRELGVKPGELYRGNLENQNASLRLTGRRPVVGTFLTYSWFRMEKRENSVEKW